MNDPQVRLLSSLGDLRGLSVMRLVLRLNDGTP